MPAYAYTPTKWDNYTLTASAPFASASFDPSNGPAQTRAMEPVVADVIGRQPAYVRSQPKSARWSLWVFMSSTTDADLLTLMRTFSESNALRYLEMTDGDGVSWRVTAMATGLNRLAANHWEVLLYVPDPTWETVAELAPVGTGNALNDSFIVAATNAGNRPVRPVLTVVVGDNKEARKEDWHNGLRFIIANRAKRALSRWPVELVRDSFAFAHNAQVQFDTPGGGSSLSGAITATQLTIPVVAAGGGNFDSPSGFGYVDAEQFWYDSISGNNLVLSSILGRGIGGTARAAHSGGALVERSRALANGDDIAVWLDGERVPDQDVHIEGENSADLRVWLNVSAAARWKGYAAVEEDWNVDYPPSGGNLPMQSDISELGASGAIIIDNECITYQSKDDAARTLNTIQRGAWGTTAAVHADTTPAYRVDHLGVLGLCKGAAARRPPEAIDTRPAIELNRSRNGTFYWGDQAQDPDTIFYDPERPNRTAQWRPKPADPDDHLAHLLQKENTPSKLAFFDYGPHTLYIPSSRYALRLPMGVETFTPAIRYEIDQTRTAIQRVLGYGMGSDPVLLREHWDFSGDVVNPVDIQSVGKLFEIELVAVPAVTASNPFGGDQSLSINSVTWLMQKVVLEHETEVQALVLKLSRAAAGTFTGMVTLWNSAGGDATPENGQIAAWFNRMSATDAMADATDNFSEADLSTTPTLYEFACVQSSARRTIRLAPGTYWIRLELTAVAGGGQVYWEGGLVETQHDAIKSAVGFSTTRRAAGFQVIHRGNGPVQQEVEESFAALLCSFDKMQIELDDGVADPQTPKVWCENAFAALTHLSGVLTSDVGDRDIAFDAWLEGTTHSLVVDCEAQTVTYINGQHRMSVPRAIAPEDDSEWFLILPGANQLLWAEPNMQGQTLTATFRSKKV